jgi:uncharacterized protein (DUF1778 family)
MAKTDLIKVRVEPTEKYLIEQQAKINGFDTVSAYVLYLIRKDGK